MKRRLLAYIPLIFAALSVTGPELFAQERIIVSGTITNRTDDNKPLTDVCVYAYGTVAEAEDAYKSYMQAKETGGYFDPGLTVYEYPNAAGYYEISAVETGALMFDPMGIADPIVKKVNYQKEINVAFEVAIVLDNSTVTAELGQKPVVDPPEIFGNTVSCGATYPFKERIGKTNARMVVQTYLLAGNEVDTLEYRMPIVYDGEQYHQTQYRRMGFRKDVDPLFLLAEENPPLTDSTVSVTWKDTVFLENPSELIYCKALIWAEDYNMVIYEDSMKIFNTGRARRPMRFLEYSFEEYNLDPNDYVKQPKRERRDAAVSTNLTFLVGKAALDPKDTAGRASLENLKQELYNVIHDEGSSLKEFYVSVTSSPDGTYYKNVELSRLRSDFASNEVTSVIPKSARKRIVMPSPKAEVASWLAVADILEKDSLMVEAAAVRKIVEQNPRSMDAQWSRIRQLPYYRTKISPRLPQLRSVTFRYISEIFRQLTPEEILHRYNTDADYRSGRKSFALYEYWHLFNMVKNQDELDLLYRRAMMDSKKAEGRLWPLPANNYAVSLMRKGICDTTILAPLIDEREPLNRIIRNKHNPKVIDEIINIEQVVANQVIMFLRAEKYMRAVELSTLLPDEKYGLLKSIARCLAGYFRDNKSKEGQQVFNTVRNSTPRNRVVMNLAVGNIGLAKAALAKLDQNDPVTQYLNAQVLCRNHDSVMGMKNAIVDFTTYESEYDKALAYLRKCFEMDENFKKIAETDWDIYEDLYKEAIQPAPPPMDEYDYSF